MTEDPRCCATGTSIINASAERNSHAEFGQTLAETSGTDAHNR